MAGQDTLTFDDGNFEAEVLNSDMPVLVDFWAAWCGPCQMVGPVIDELATEYKGRAKIGKLDVDAAGEVAGKYGVQSIPTVMLFDQGQAVETIVGARTKNDYKTVLEARLGAAGGDG
jgi:thioredoxin 1